MDYPAAQPTLVLRVNPEKYLPAPPPPPPPPPPLHLHPNTTVRSRAPRAMGKRAAFFGTKWGVVWFVGTQKTTLSTNWNLVRTRQMVSQHNITQHNTTQYKTTLPQPENGHSTLTHKGGGMQ